MIDIQEFNMPKDLQSMINQIIVYKCDISYKNLTTVFLNILYNCLYNCIIEYSI